MLLHSVNLWNLAFYAFMVFMATLGLWDVFFGFEENKCSMSYMFEYPEYQVRFCPPFAGRSEARAPPALPFGAFPLPRPPAPLPSPYPCCVFAFLAPEYFAAPAVLFFCPLCPLFSVGSLIDGSRSILPAPLEVAPSSSARFAVPNPKQRRAGPDAPHPRRLSSSPFPQMPPPSLPALTGAPSPLLPTRRNASPPAQ